MQTVDTYRQGLDAINLAMVDALRAIVSAAGPQLTERIKWNAPSFAVGDVDRITLGVAPKGGVRVVLHRGAKARDGEGVAFSDPTGLAKWPAPDRGVVEFADLAAIHANADRLADLCARWLELPA